MNSLRFLIGKWRCDLIGVGTSGVALDIDYSFSPDGLWMLEVSKDAGTLSRDWAMQVWGYDKNSKKLVAYDFTPRGVFTKSVEGWINGEFVSHRDDNNAAVSLRRLSDAHITWQISSANQRSVVTQDCRRR
jgi:hypothetical protein